MTLQDILNLHDVGVPGYRIGEPMLFDALLALLGWQGGTVHAALAAARAQCASKTHRS